MTQVFIWNIVVRYCDFKTKLILFRVSKDIEITITEIDNKYTRLLTDDILLQSKYNGL